MPTPGSVKAFYDERAGLAYTIEHLPLGSTEKNLARYAALQDELISMQDAFIQTWRQPSAEARPLLPWCSLCGSKDRALLPGKMLCIVCAALSGEAAVSEEHTKEVS